MIEDDLKILAENRKKWENEVSNEQKIEMLEKTYKNLLNLFNEWLSKDLEARKTPPGHWGAGDSFNQVAVSGRLIRLYIQSLKEEKKYDDKKPLKVFPWGFKESLTLPNTWAEVRFKESPKIKKGGTVAIFGAGNVAWLAVTDILQKLIVEKKVVLYKVHPALDYLKEIMSKCFEPFIEANVLRVISGGVDVGENLINHPLVNEIYMTGSEKTFQKIVSKTNKPVYAEVGCVSPVIIVPGEWSEKDFDYHADNLLFFVGSNNGYNCCAGRVIITQKGWDGTEKLLKKLKEKMGQVQLPLNYYPGTENVIKDACSAYPNMEVVGKPTEKHQPWMLAKELDSNADEVAYKREFWGTFISQTSIEANSAEEFLDKAVDFANNRLWGTLSATIIADPKVEKKIDKAIDNLKYGTVAVNFFPGMSYLIGRTPWGGYPGYDRTDIQSGNCFVNNPLGLENVEKSVIYSSFTQPMRPLWFLTGDKPMWLASRVLKFLMTGKFRSLFFNSI